MINGLVDKPLVFTMEDLERPCLPLPLLQVCCQLRYGMARGTAGRSVHHGMIHNVQYTGVPVNLLEKRPEDQCEMDHGKAPTSGMFAHPADKMLDDCIMAFKMNGEALRPEQGYPIRLVVPGWEGNMWIEWLRRQVGDQLWHAGRNFRT